MLILHSLVELKNALIRQGRYTDCIDELIFKVVNAPVKKMKKAPETEAVPETATDVTEREPVQSEMVRQTEPVKQSEAETPATKPTTENNNPLPAETPT